MIPVKVLYEIKYKAHTYSKMIIYIVGPEQVRVKELVTQRICNLGRLFYCFS